MSIVKLTPKMTSNTTPSGEVTCSHYHNEYYLPFYAFNEEYGDNMYTWGTTQALPQWICYHFPKQVRVTRIKTVNRNETYVRAVSEYTLQGSNDGTSWTDIVTCNLSDSSAHAEATFDIENNNWYYYYRLYITGNYNNATGTGCGFAEVELYGVTVINAAGDIKAIGDWFKGTRYSKNKIFNLFIQNNDYTPYNLTIIGDADSDITITGETSGRVYYLKLPNTGEVSELLFFDLGETITATDGTNTITKTLSAQNDTIRLVPDISAITRVDQYTELGNHSYTIPEDGTYLLILSSGAGYDPSTVSYTLPYGRNEIVSDVVTNADGTYGYQMRYMIANLKENDVIQTNTFRTAGQWAWPSMINALYKIDGYIVDPDVTCDLTRVGDGNAIYTPPNNNDKYLELGIAYSGYNMTRNDTNLTGKDPEIVVEESVGYQSLIAMYYGEGNKLPTISMYGYNGGGGVVACLKIANKRADV